MGEHLIIATRGSALALWQANHVKECLQENDSSLKVSLNIIKTKGDILPDAPLAAIGGKGVFVKEIEEALLAGRADLAVHSAKDVPMELPSGLIIGCVPKRESVEDCLLSHRYSSLEKLPPGASIGTSSLRRQAQLLALRPDLRIKPLRGNIDTRLRKLEDGEVDAMILAMAGLSRLGLHAPFMTPLDPDEFLPAPGQGALAIECQEDNYGLLVRLSMLEDRDSRVCLDAERSFLAELEGGCQAPIAARATMLDEESLILQGLVGEADGSRIVRARAGGDAIDSRNIGREAAREILASGGAEILGKYYSNA